MLYGEELHVIEAANSDSGTMTAINLTASLAAEALAKTMWIPGVAVAFGYRCVTAFTLGSTPTPAVLELFKYPNGLVADDLQTAMEMYNSLVVTMNAHAADVTMHALADTGNFSAALTPQTPVTGLAGLLVGLNLLETAYIAHNVDAAAGTLYHAGAGTTHLVAGAGTATTLATALVQLNALLAAYNLHELELTCHAIANLHPGVKVSLGTIKLNAGYLPGKIYQVKVPNKVIDQVPVQPGNAQYNVGDELVVQVTTLAIGGTKAGTLQPFIVHSNRGESSGNQEQLVDLTPAIVGI